MSSEPKGLMYIPVWVDDGVVKALVTDDGRIPVQLGGSDISLDVNLQASDITLPVSEQSPLSTIEARVYTFYNGSWQNAPTETDGSLHVYLTGLDGTLAIQQNMPSLLQPGVNTHDGTSWTKQPLILGYTHRTCESLDTACDDSGFVIVTSTEVLTTRVYVVEAVACKITERATTSVEISVEGDAVFCPLKTSATLAVNTWFVWTGKVTLGRTDYIKVYINGTQENDTLECRVRSYYMRLNL